MKPAQLARLLDAEFASVERGEHTPVMIWGPPGVGKSQLVAQAARIHGVAVIDLRLSQLEPSDLRGIPYREGSRVEWAPPSALPDAERHGPRGFLFLDEITSALPSVAAAAYQLILDRRLGDYQVPPGWAIIAAGNRLSDRGVVYAMPAPLANRFAHVELQPDIDDWLAWAQQAGLDARLRAFLADNPRWLFDYDPDLRPLAFPTPRAWAFVDRALRKFGDDAQLLPSAVAGCVGEAAANALLGFLASGAVEVEGWLNDPPRVRGLDAAQLAELSTRALAWLDRQAAPLDAAPRLLALVAQIDDPGLSLHLVLGLRERLGESLYRLPAFSDWCDAVGDALVDVVQA